MNLERKFEKEFASDLRKETADKLRDIKNRPNTFEDLQKEKFIPNNENNTETKRSELAQRVKDELTIIGDNIIQFNILTSSRKAGGLWDTNEGVKPVQYDDRYKEFFELYGVTSPEQLLTNNGFIYDKELRKVTFTGYLGRTLDNNGKRDGNGLFITLKFNKEFNPEEIIKNISKLLDTIIAYRGNDNNPNRTPAQDLSGIAKEGIQILEVFEKITEKFPATGRISVKSIIEEYKELLFQK